MHPGESDPPDRRPRRAGMRAAVALATAVGVAALGLMGAYTWRMQQTNRHLLLALETDRQRNFASLVTHVEGLQTALGKGLATGSPRLNLHYLEEVRLHASAALAHVAGLPLPEPLTADANKYLTQTGDFANSVARREAAGEAMDGAQRQQLAALYQATAELNASLQDLALRPETLSGLFPDGLQQVVSGVQRYPPPDYDGPLSDRIANRAAAVTGPPVTREQAASLLPRFVPGFANWQVMEVTETAGTVPAWTFRLAPQGAPARGTAKNGDEAEGPAITVDVARDGGHLLGLLNARPAGAPVVSLAQARELGQAYLMAAGYSGMEPTWDDVSDGFAIITYVARQDDVRLNPDEIKVRLALDNGEVVAVDAFAFLMNHITRRLPQPLISPEDAIGALHDELDVEDVRLAVINRPGGTAEILVYEVRAARGGDIYLVDVNALTGQEERVRQVLATETGTSAW